MNNLSTSRNSVDELFAGIESGDFTVFDRVFTNDAVVWHNTDSVAKAIPGVRAQLEKMFKLVVDWKYTVSARIPFPGGLVQQHSVKISLSDKAALEFPACLVVKIADGKISRIDEYFDSSAAFLLNQLTFVG